MMLPAAGRLSEDTPERNTPITIGAVLMVAWSVFSALTLVPAIVERVRQERSAGVAALLRWAFAAVPFPVALAATVAGGQRWLLAVGFFASVVLLVRAARALRREGAGG